jgi:hypothetical protein
MQIHDFYSKLTSGKEPSILFQALRNLSLVEDAQAVFAGEGDDVLIDWGAWPPAGGDASYVAVQA